MIYSTPEFLALLFVLVPLYRLIPYMGRRVVLVIASLLFIFWAGAITTALLLLSVMVIWGVVRLGSSGWGKTLPVQAGVALLALNLVFWKYTPWILTQFGVDPDTPFLRFLADVGLPIGISFYTLQGIAYLVDYHRGEAPPRGFVDFLLFKAFFAQLIAGPIVRHYELFPQLDRMPVSTTAQVQSGIELFALGFFKKLVLGDGSAQFVDPVFANMSEFRNGDVLLAVVLYTVQIYGDFSGYTDMGRGAARMLGIELPENFSAPYLSTSLREFWRRWHITFGRWLRDYIYIPLGGNRGGFRRTLLNVGVTMTLCGLWHGAAWNFVLWGIYNGVIMMAEHVQERLFGWKLPRLLAIPTTLFLIMGGWVIFRVEQLSDLRTFSLKVLTALTDGVVLKEPRMLAVTLIFATITIALQIGQNRFQSMYEAFTTLPGAIRGAAAGSIFVLSLLLRGHEAPFIYFDF